MGGYLQKRKTYETFNTIIRRSQIEVVSIRCEAVVCLETHYSQGQEITLCGDTTDLIWETAVDEYTYAYAP